MARGAVGDVVFSRVGGQQIARSRNRSPKNPQSPNQLLQRIVFNTASKAYSRLQAICNHSFEGYAEGTPCQSRFMELNADYLRGLLAFEIASPYEESLIESNVTSFNRKGDPTAVCNEYVISQGSLPSTRISPASGWMFSLAVPFAGLSTESTYDDVIASLGLRRGDQLTFCVATFNSSSSNPEQRGFITAFEFARVILEPADGDFSSAFFAGSENRYTVAQPNPRNEGSVIFSGVLSGVIRVNSINNVSQTSDDATVGFYPILAAVIVSRLVGSTWARSTQSLVWTRSPGYQPENDLFKLAYLSYKKEQSSSLYLNQAGI